MGVEVGSGIHAISLIAESDCLQAQFATRPDSLFAIQWPVDSKTLRRQNLAEIEDEFDSLAEIERRTNGEVTASYLSQVKNGYRQMGDRVARRLEALLGRPTGWMDQPNRAPLPKRPSLRVAGNSGVSSSVHSVELLERFADVPQVTIPLLEIRASAGAGELRPAADAITGVMQLSAEWVRRNLPDITSPKNLRVISGYGDSMEPTFRDGDILIVDTGVRDVRIDTLYVFSLDDELYVKTLQRVPGGLRVISDNKKYDPYMLEEATRRNLNIIGRVVWTWNGRKL